MRSKDKDLEAAVESVSGDQFKDQSLQCAVGAGRVQGKHVKVPAVDVLRVKTKAKQEHVIDGPPTPPTPCEVRLAVQTPDGR